jgi:WD40 repeat protein
MGFSVDGQLLLIPSYQDNRVKLWDLGAGQERKLAPWSASGLTAWAFSSDNRLVAVGDSHRSVTLWDIQANKEYASFPGPVFGFLTSDQPGVAFLAFAPGNKELVEVSTKGAGSVIDVSQRKKRATFTTGGPAAALEVAPDGRTFATLRNDGLLQVWEAATGKEWATPIRRDPRATAAPLAVSCMAYAPSGGLLAAGCRDGSLVLWDANTRKERSRVQAFSASFDQVQFSRDGKTLVARRRGDIMLWDPLTGTERAKPPKDYGALTSLALAPNSRDLALAGGVGNVMLWDLTSNKVRGVVQKSVAATTAFLVFSPDGKTVAVPHNNNTVTLWDVATGQERLTVPAVVQMFNQQTTIALGNETLAVTDSTGAVTLWDVASGKKRATLPETKPAVNYLALSPDGAFLASSRLNASVTIWNVRASKTEFVAVGGQGPVEFASDGRLLLFFNRQPYGHVLWDVAAHKERIPLRNVQSAAFSRDGRMLAVAQSPQSVVLWDLTTGKEKLSLPLDGSLGLNRLVFSPDGQALAVHRYQQIQVFDTGTGKAYPVIKEEAFNQTSFFAAGSKILATQNYLSQVTLWDLTTGKELASLKSQNPVAVRGDGSLVASSPAEFMGTGNITLWDPATGQEQVTLRSSQRESWQTLGFSPDGTLLAAVSQSGTVKLWDTVQLKDRLTIRDQHGPVQALAVASDGKTAASASADHTVRIWDLATGQTRAVLQGHTGMVLAVAFPPRKSPKAVAPLIATAGADMTVRLWDAASGRPRSILRGHQDMRGHEDAVWALAFSPDGKTLASGSADRTIKLWDAATGRENAVLKGHTTAVLGLAFAADGKTLASAGGDLFGTLRTGEIKLWNPDAGQERTALRTQAGAVRALAFSPDGQLLATGGVDRTVMVWDAKTGEEKAILQGHHLPISGVAFSPDGQALASSACSLANPFEPGEVLLWDLATGQRRPLLLGHRTGVSCLVFRGDGRTLLTAGMDETVKVWNVESDKSQNPPPVTH